MSTDTPKPATPKRTDSRRGFDWADGRVVSAIVFGVSVLSLGLLEVARSPEVTATAIDGLEDYFITDPQVNTSTVVSATVILVLVGALAGYVPARRAAKIKPIVALADE